MNITMKIVSALCSSGEEAVDELQFFQTRKMCIPKMTEIYCQYHTTEVVHFFSFIA